MPHTDRFAGSEEEEVLINCLLKPHYARSIHRNQILSTTVTPISSFHSTAYYYFWLLFVDSCSNGHDGTVFHLTSRPNSLVWARRIDGGVSICLVSVTLSDDASQCLFTLTFNPAPAFFSFSLRWEMRWTCAASFGLIWSFSSWFILQMKMKGSPRTAKTSKAAVYTHTQRHTRARTSIASR